MLFQGSISFEGVSTMLFQGSISFKGVSKMFVLGFKPFFFKGVLKMLF
jgi:hypothetical protein